MNLLAEYTEDKGIILDTLIDEDGQEYVWAMNEKAKEFSFSTRDPKAINGFKDFLRKNPVITGVAVGVGINALDNYKANKRLTTRFFATNATERRLYQKVADDLVKTGNYTMMKDGKRIKSGWLWELKRRSI